MKTTFAILIVAISIANALEFQDCGSKMGRFTRVEVSDCDTSKSACVLKRQTNATISIDFELDEDVSTITTVVHGIIVHVEIPFALSNPDACVGCGLECPLKSKSQNKYVASLPVLKSYPRVKVDVKWELRDDQGTTIVCVLIPAKIE